MVTIPSHPTRSAPAPASALVERYRRLRTDPQARAILRSRAATTAALRSHLARAGHIEIDSPLLHSRPCPAPGRSFRTETDHLSPHTYLRSSPLHLRAMLTTGFDRVYEIGRTFRDEPADLTHAAEYTLVEVYRADTDYAGMADLARDLILCAAHTARGTTRITLPGGTYLDLAGEWPRTSLHAALSDTLDTPVTAATPLPRLQALAEKHQVRLSPKADAAAAALDLYETLVEPQLMGPVFVTDHPARLSPMALACAHDPRLAQKWDLVIGGVEIAAGYTEVTDPGELTERLASPLPNTPPAHEAETIDEDFLAVFAAGMPPAGGLCIGLDRLVQTLTGAPALTDVIPFLATGS